MVEHDTHAGPERRGGGDNATEHRRRQSDVRNQHDETPTPRDRGATDVGRTMGGANLGHKPSEHELTHD